MTVGQAENEKDNRSSRRIDNRTKRLRCWNRISILLVRGTKGPKTLKFSWVSKNHIKAPTRKKGKKNCKRMRIASCTYCMYVCVCVCYGAIHRKKRHRGLKTDILADPSVPAS